MFVGTYDERQPRYVTDGKVCELIRAALHPYPDELVLVSKVGARRDAAGAWLPAQRPEQLRARMSC